MLQELFKSIKLGYGYGRIYRQGSAEHRRGRYSSAVFAIRNMPNYVRYSWKHHSH